MYNVGEIETATKFQTTNLRTVSIFKFNLPVAAMNINIFVNQCKHICSDIQGFL